MTKKAPAVRLKIVLYGAVQGVGFRPFVYRLATELKLTGWVLNSVQGVFIEAEGPQEQLEEFLRRLERDKPPHAFIQSLESSWLDPVGYPAFEIRHSEESGQKTAFILPDIATCPDCLREVFDPTDRRYRYPFTNCTNCGPRFSIIEALPYDRPNTTMKKFPMCSDCQAEYQDPTNRRFHAQPNACPTCGPHLELWDSKGNVLAQHDDALRQTAEAIRTGQIVAVKGLGGFHLICDARNDDAVRQLRRRKHREEKPFALMYPSLELVKAHCEVSELEERVLTSPEAPIVLLKALTPPY
ncbi:MAG: Sua5/YciO/YrdC/YwlC family protein, partial [Candidatus Bipolaricaulota bacterium]|nr:Sua5/YciO/YrdC/YwlC family protein [Candidatus Bipolaricaulota bacterium]